MNRGSEFEEYRALILRCKRPELDKLIKSTDLPRGGLKQDLQLRLISYLDQEPPDAFLNSLNDLLLRQKNSAVALSGSQPNGLLLPCPTGGLWLSSRDECDASFGRQVSNDQSNSFSSPTNLTTTPLWSSWDGSTSASQTQSPVTLGCLPNSSFPTSTANYGATPFLDQSGHGGNTNTGASSEKNLLYQLQPGPIGPLIGLAGAKGSFRLPACLPGFRFRDSPFFKEIDTLLVPQIMTPNHISFATGRRSYDRSLALRFTPDQAETITYHCRRLSNDRMDFGVQVIMRFARMDPDLTTQLVDAYGLTNSRGSRLDPIPQPRMLTLSEDSLPVHLAIQVNGRPVQLPPLLPSNRPGLDGRRNPRPINITQFLRVSPAIANYIRLTWTHDYSSFVYSLVGIYLMHKWSPQQLCALLQSTSFQSAETMKAELIRKLQTGRPKTNKAQPKSSIGLTTQVPTVDDNNSTTIVDDEDEEDDDLVMPNTLPVQLLCPLSKCRIEVPVRGRDCRHIQCYDATTYLIINERKPSWNCPVCDRKVYYEDLIIDGLFLEVLNSKAAQDLDEAVFHDDGTWSVLAERAKAHNSPGSSDSSDSDDSDEPKPHSESGKSGSLNNLGTTPVSGVQRTPNSVISTLEPDSVGSSTTTISTGLSFGAVSPAGSGSSSNAPLFFNPPSNSPLRCGASVPTTPLQSGSTAFRAPSHLSSHPIGPDKDIDRPVQMQNITIDLTASDDETDKSSRSSSVDNRSHPVVGPEISNPQYHAATRNSSISQQPTNPSSLVPPASGLPIPALTKDTLSIPGPLSCPPIVTPQSVSPGTLPKPVGPLAVSSSSADLASTSNTNNPTQSPVWPQHSTNASIAVPSAVPTGAPTSFESRKRGCDMSQRTATSDSDVPFEARFARSNGNSSDPNYASGLRSLSAKHSRHDPSLTSAPIPSSSTPVSSPTSLPDFGSAYETFDRRAQAYNPDPYHFYRHPPAVPSGRQSTGFPCRSNGSEFNNPPHMYHSQFAPHLPQHHSQSASSISSGYSGSPFDSAHSRRFRPGSTPGTDRQTPPYQINPMYSGDMPHMYSSADNAYARYLTDPPVHSRPEVSNLLAPSHGPGFTERHVSRQSGRTDSRFTPASFSRPLDHHYFHDHQHHHRNSPSQSPALHWNARNGTTTYHARRP
ncbi:E3 SUMO protein ligase PIAS2 [Fasciolopsis buskii]|uniref:E3 SUMO protein ligase PIAS2 n=1 Tax=Fasciolopsis buskii TaxID=27845 RepID=A0A8E0VGV3_9TREM|nr:E3 SUMO protein ligase PIAS2 [Fasciolopsis buski]